MPYINNKCAPLKLWFSEVDKRLYWSSVFIASTKCLTKKILEGVQVKKLRLALQSGVAMVEFAFVLPVFLMMTFGIVELALIIYDKAVIANASREATRAGIRYVPNNTVTNVNSVVSAKAQNYCNQTLISLAGSKNCTIAVFCNQSGTQECTNTNVNTFSSPLNVKVSYNYQGLFLAPFLKFSSNGISLTSSTVMYME